MVVSSITGIPHQQSLDDTSAVSLNDRYGRRKNTMSPISMSRGCILMSSYGDAFSVVVNDEVVDGAIKLA